MTCNTISLVSRLRWKRFRWKFIYIFEDVCPLHTCFSADSFHILCCVTPCESSGRFFRATRYGPCSAYREDNVSNMFPRFDASELQLQKSSRYTRWRHRVYGHDTVAILWVYSVTSCVELNREDSSCYSNKTGSVTPTLTLFNSAWPFGNGLTQQHFTY